MFSAGYVWQKLHQAMTRLVDYEDILTRLTHAGQSLCIVWDDLEDLPQDLQKDLADIRRTYKHGIDDLEREEAVRLASTILSAYHEASELCGLTQERDAEWSADPSRRNSDSVEAVQIAKFPGKSETWDGLGCHQFRQMPRVGERIAKNIHGVGQLFKVVAVHHPDCAAFTPGDVFVVHVGTVVEEMKALFHEAGFGDTEDRDPLAAAGKLNAEQLKALAAYDEELIKIREARSAG